MDFEPCFKAHNIVSVHPKSIKLGQMTNLTGFFHVVVSDYRLLKIKNSHQFPAQPRNGQKVLALLYFIYLFFLGGGGGWLGI